MIRITLALTGAVTGALAALTFSAATAHADPDAPTPFGDSWGFTQSYVPYVVLQDQQYTDYSVLNDPSETFVGLWRGDIGYLNGLDDHNVSVVQDISGNVPVGEQYNIFTFDDVWGEVYNSIGATPEAFYITPFGDLDVPTWFVEAVGPTFSSRRPHGWRGCCDAGPPVLDAGRPSGLTRRRMRCTVIHVI